jgi:hypothetical protein
MRDLRTLPAVPIALAACLALGVPRASADDAFIAGYATAVLEREFPESKAGVRVSEGVVFLRPGGLQGRDLEKAVASLSRIAGVREVRVEEAAAPPPDQGARATTGGPWHAFPAQRLFPPLLADPRWAHFSIGYQYFLKSDFPELRNTAVVSLGELFNVVGYETQDLGSFTAGIEPAIFALFNLDALSQDLVNADYRLALPFEYRKRSVSLRASVLHQSSHLGDEFLLDTSIERINLSYEAVDLRVSVQAGDVRFYAGAERLVHSEPRDLEVWKAQQGVEWLSGAGLFGVAVAPLVAVDVQERQETDWRPSVGVRAGVELVNPEKTRRRIQILLEYYHGDHPNGQFYRERVDYFGFGLHAYF